MAQSYQLPHAIRDELFKDLAKEKATQLVGLIEKSIDTVFSSAKDIAVQKKLEIKDELSKELASKADLAVLKAELLLEIERVDSKLSAEIKATKSESRIYFIILLSAMIILNKDSITFIAQLLGLVK